jgi:hypothetical protein
VSPEAQSGIGADTRNAVSSLIARFKVMCRAEALRLGVAPHDVIDLATLELFAERIERTLGPLDPRRSP